MPRSEFLSFSRISYNHLEADAIEQVLRSGWLTTGSLAAQFEQDLASYVGGEQHALAVNSCTAAMHLSLVAKGIGPGDIVATTPLTFCSTVSVIEHVGAKAVLVDVDRDTGNMDPDSLARVLREHAVKAIVPVHYSGLPCSMKEIRQIVEANGDIFILEDAAHAVGAEYEGLKVGAGSEAVAFSFYATKNLTTAEGGMLVSRDADFIDRCRVLSLHGLSRDAWKRYEDKGSWYYEVEAAGFKYNMPDILAALGIEQLKRLDEMNHRRSSIAAAYNSSFTSCEFLEPFQRNIPTDRKHAHHLYPIVLNLEALSIDRARFIEELRERNIGTSVHFIPIHYHPYYKKKYGWQDGDFPNAEYLYKRFISLPIYPGMTDGDVVDVADAVRDVANVFSR